MKYFLVSLLLFFSPMAMAGEEKESDTQKEQKKAQEKLKESTMATSTVSCDCVLNIGVEMKKDGEDYVALLEYTRAVEAEGHDLIEVLKDAKNRCESNCIVHIPTVLTHDYSDRISLESLYKGIKKSEQACQNGEEIYQPVFYTPCTVKTPY